MTSRTLVAGLAALLVAGCSEKAPQTNRPIAPTKITASKDYDALQQTLANLEGHTLIRDVRGIYEGYDARVLVYQSKWNATDEIHAIELINPLTKERLYAATPLGKEGPFNRSKDSSAAFTYSSDTLAEIYRILSEKK